RGYRVSATRVPACFAPDPHCTRALSAADGSLALVRGPPRFSQGSSVPPTYSGTHATPAITLRLRGSHPLRRAVPGRFGSRKCGCGISPHGPHNPGPSKEAGLGSSPFARRYLGNLV